MSQQDTETMSTLIVSLLYLLYAILILAAQWKMYQKMGRKGWESLVPFRNIYVIFEELYADGWKKYIISSEPEFEHYFGRQAVKKRKLYNGRLQCNVYMYY